MMVTNHLAFKPVSTQYLIIGMLKSLYLTKFQQAMADAHKRKRMFCLVNGTEEVYRIIQESKYVAWKLGASSNRRSAMPSSPNEKILDRGIREVV